MSDDLRSRLTDEQYRVTQQQGTERPFQNAYWDNKEEGVYKCVVCHEPLFASATKFESGTGWPSFYEPTAEDNVEIKRDLSHGMVRSEVVCKNCGAHLGHLFDDAPQTPTGMRYCLNSASLDFEKK